MRPDEDPQSRVLYELCSMIIQLLRCPSPRRLPFPALYSPAGPSSSSSSSSSSIRCNTTSYSFPAPSQISPIAFASLFLGISLALMLFGSVTFLIGFMLLPWVIGLVLIFYFAGLVSSLSESGWSFLCWALCPQDVTAWKCS